MIIYEWKSRSILCVSKSGHLDGYEIYFNPYLYSSLPEDTHIVGLSPGAGAYNGHKFANATQQMLVSSFDTGNGNINGNINGSIPISPITSATLQSPVYLYATNKYNNTTFQLNIDTTNKGLNLKTQTPQTLFFRYPTTADIPDNILSLINNDIVGYVPFIYTGIDNKKYVLIATATEPESSNFFIDSVLSFMNKPKSIEINYSNDIAEKFYLNTIYYTKYSKGSVPPGSVFFTQDNGTYYLCIDEQNNIYWTSDEKHQYISSITSS